MGMKCFIAIPGIQFPHQPNEPTQQGENEATTAHPDTDSSQDSATAEGCHLELLVTMSNK